MLFPTFVYADNSLSLQQTLAQMLQHNRQLKAGAEHVAAMQTQTDAAQAQALPKIDVSTAWNYSNDPLQVFGSKLSQQSVGTADFAPQTLNYPAYRQNYQTRLGLSLPLFTGGGLQAATSQAQAQAEASSLMFEFQKQQQMYQTIALFLQLRQLRDQQQMQKKSVQAAEKHWQDVKALQAKGMALMSDVMHAHVYVLQRQQRLAQADNQVLNAQDKLSLIMGNHQNLQHVNLLLPRIPVAMPSLTQLLQQALDTRLDLKAMQQQRNMALAHQKQLHSHDFPQVNLMAAQTWNSVNPNIQHGNSMVGITLSMNLFNGGGDDAEQRGAVRAISELDWNIQDQQQNIQQQIKQAYRAYTLAQQQSQRQQQAAKQTQEALRIQALRYQQGLETTSNLLDAQLASDQAELASIQAGYDVMLSKAALLFAAGLLHEGVIQ